MSAVPERLVIGSRRSALARAQAEAVGRRLARAWPGVVVSYATLETEGDRVLDRPLPEVGGKGLFTAALEDALRSGEVDVAVHSLKDLPTDPSPGLALLATPEREDPRDVLVVEGAAEGADPEDLPSGAVVGTSSLRRRALLLRRRPDCRVRSVRGNVETRLEKLRRGEYDALVLAAAGLRRLGLLDARMRPLEAPDWLPAPGQGALAVQGRAADAGVRRVLEAVGDPGSRRAVRAERALLEALQGGCQIPIGALAGPGPDGTLLLRAVVLSPDGDEAIDGSRRAEGEEPAALGRALAADLRARGVGRLLAMAERHGAEAEPW